jgi:hypothetical protein
MTGLFIGMSNPKVEYPPMVQSLDKRDCRSRKSATPLCSHSPLAVNRLSGIPYDDHGHVKATQPSFEAGNGGAKRCSSEKEGDRRPSGGR